MSSRISQVVVLLVTLVAALPAVASAAPSIRFEHPCYQDNGPPGKAAFQADGFAPDSVVPVTLDGQVIGQVTADERGSLMASFPVPARPTPQQVESMHELVLTPAQGDPVRATFLTTAIAADFAPTRGDPRTMKVRFTAFGMNLVQPSSRVYVHYVAPGGKHRRTLALGHATGACGRLQSSLRKLFPFNPSRGKWTLQLDTAKAYRRGSAQTAYPWARIGVAVTGDRTGKAVSVR